jgi:hypothetical protein
VSNDFFAQFPNCLTYTTRDEFVGNLFYAMTHSPEPLTAEYRYALTWKAATERLIAASAIPVKEFEEREAALKSKDAGIDITLPPLVESEEGRKLVSTTLRYTRHRYRQFRSRLSNEILHNKVLPASIKERLREDLEKRLDFDIDEILESPKLRLKISPAELDKQLLELYDQLTRGPGGDVLRLIGGGGQVGMQNLYMRRLAQKRRKRTGKIPDPVPFYLAESESADSPRTLVGGIRRVLRRNLPPSSLSVTSRPNMRASQHIGEQEDPTVSMSNISRKSTKMSSSGLHAHTIHVNSARPAHFTSRCRFSLLI